MTIKRGGWKWGEGKRTPQRLAADKRQAENLAKGLCRCGRPHEPERVCCTTCLDRGSTQHYQRRKEVLAAYGNKCACCSESEEAFLTMDHINEDGAEQRATVRSHTNLYYWLLANGCPKTFQILCYNCNYSKARRGICPHELARRLHAAGVP